MNAAAAKAPLIGDANMMKIALSASRSSSRLARPNPWVGAVVLSTDGQVFTGATGAPGDRHAEVAALDKAGGASVGSTMWVTLEPCSHYGKTPPCTERIIAAGVARVVAGLVDPDERVNGSGLRRLAAAGIEVAAGVEADAVASELLAYLCLKSWGRPMVTLKMAMTLDGFIAAADGTSKWITGEDARRHVQELREQADVIMVGAGTARADNPRLDVRTSDGTRLPSSPRRVVLGTLAAEAAAQPALSWHGSLGDLMSRLSTEGALSVLAEGGAKVAHSLLAAGLVDRFHLFVAPKALGGEEGLRLFSGPGATTMADAKPLSMVATRQCGQDVELVMESDALSALRRRIVGSSRDFLL